MDFINQLTNTAPRLPKEELENVTKFTFVKRIDSRWKSNDEGRSLDLYIGFAEDGVTPRYFLKYFCREWWGGWSYDETTTWYELSRQEYLKLCENNYTL